MDEKSVFDTARKIPDLDARDEFLRAVCADDTAALSRIRNRLAVHANDSDAVESPSVDVTDTVSMMDDERSQVGRRIGVYKLLQKIGEGGMGAVFMAEQTEPVKRRVALKIIKAGMDSKQVIARFEAERQALAMMDHPNIARLLDVGTTDAGRPYFVMELVKGAPITKYCDEKNLDLNQRLQLFQSVCRAVQHAHQKGIIHRDLKPSNVLVAEYDDRVIPKIIDFGLAKALHHNLTDATMFTQFGQVVGTLAYMSPEQSKMNQIDVDTRTDIYSLAVLLYELLTGTTPFDSNRLKSAAIDQVMKIIREEEPPRPSTRLSSIESRPEIATSRGTEPKKLRLMIRGDLDWIVMKALEKDRNRRYDTANGLNFDIQRYLDGEPVLAAPPRAGYRLRKFVSRNRAMVVAGSIMTAILIFGVIGTSLGLVWALNERDKAKSAEAAEAEAKDDALSSANTAIEQTKRANTAAKRALSQENEAKRLRQVADERAVRAEKAERVAVLRAYFGKINLAHTEWKHGDPALAVRTLSSCNWLLRGWEHDYLYTEFNKNHKTIRNQLRAAFSICFSPDGKQIAAGDYQGTIKIWDTTSNELQATLKGHRKKVSSLVYSTDGTRIVSSSNDKTIKIWNAESGQNLLTIDCSYPVESITLSRDGKRVAGGGRNKRIQIWDAEDGTEIMSIDGHASDVTSLAFSHLGNRIVSGSRDRSVKIWNAETGKQMIELQGHRESVRTVAFAPDGTQVVSGDYDGIVKTWNATTGQQILSIQDVERGYVLGVAFSPDGEHIASGGYHTMLKIWDAKTGREVQALKGHSTVINSLAYSLDGKQIASCDHQGTIKIWDLGRLARGPLALKHIAEVADASFSPKGNRVVSADKNGHIKIWDVETGTEQQSLNSHQESVKSVVFLDDEQIVSGGKDHTVKIWDAENGREVHRLEGHSDNVQCVAISPDRTRIASGSLDKSIIIWDAVRGSKQSTLMGHTHQVSSVAFSPDGTRLASGDFGMKIKIWDVKTGKQILTLEGHRGSVKSVDFSPDGSKLCSASIDHTITIWDAEKGDELLTLSGHSEEVSSASFSPDGTRIVSSAFDKTVKVWDVESGETCLTLKGHAYNVNHAEFSPNGNSIVSASNDESVMIWDARNRQPKNMNKDVTDVLARAWQAVQFANRDQLAVRKALLDATAVCKYFPNENSYKTLGIAQYRAGQFESSIETFEKSLALNQQSFFALTFLAMAHWELGAQQEANRFRKQLDVLLELEKFQADEYAPFRSELDALFASGSNRSK